MCPEQIVFENIKSVLSDVSHDVFDDLGDPKDPEPVAEPVDDTLDYLATELEAMVAANAAEEAEEGSEEEEEDIGGPSARITLGKRRSKEFGCTEFIFTSLPGGYKTTEMEVVRLRTREDFEEFFIPQYAQTKETAPCIIPAVFKKAANHTKAGHRKGSDVLYSTAMIFDIDYGNVSQSDIEEALRGLSSIFYQTWKSGRKHGNRWRVIIPVEGGMGDRDQYRRLVAINARSFEKRLQKASGLQIPLLDMSASRLTQPAILPVSPKDGTGSDEAPWGGNRPKVIFTEGSVIRLPRLARELTARKRRKFGQGSRYKAIQRKYAPSKDVTPYRGEVAKGANVLMNKMNVKGIRQKPLECMDGCAYMAEHGVPPTKGGRHDRILGVLWTYYRFGFTQEEMGSIINRVIEKSVDQDQEYLKQEVRKLLKYYWSLDRTPTRYAALIWDLIVKKIDMSKFGDRQDEAKRYVRVITRAKHLQGKEGGQISHEDLSKIIGVQPKFIVKIRSLIEDEGLLSKHGENHERRYVLKPYSEAVEFLGVSPDDDAELHADESEEADPHIPGIYLEADGVALWDTDSDGSEFLIGGVDKAPLNKQYERIKAGTEVRCTFNMQIQVPEMHTVAKEKGSVILLGSYTGTVTFKSSNWCICKIEGRQYKIPKYLIHEIQN